MKLEEHFTLFEVEKITKRKVATLRKDIRQRKIDYVQIGRQIRIPAKAVEKLISDGYRPEIKEFDREA